jgi:hypothetical protein
MAGVVVVELQFAGLHLPSSLMAAAIATVSSRNSLRVSVILEKYQS